MKQNTRYLSTCEYQIIENFTEENELFLRLAGFEETTARSCFKQIPLGDYCKPHLGDKWVFGCRRDRYFRVRNSAVIIPQGSVIRCEVVKNSLVRGASAIVGIKCGVKKNDSYFFFKVLVKRYAFYEYSLAEVTLQHD